MDTTQLISRIHSDKAIMAGKPVIKGTRITVEHILGLLISGVTIEEIVQDYPHITRNDVIACLAFAQKTIESSSFMPLGL